MVCGVVVVVVVHGAPFTVGLRRRSHLTVLDSAQLPDPPRNDVHLPVQPHEPHQSPLAHAEVCDFDMTIPVEHHIVELKVAIDEIMCVQIFKY